MITFVRDGLARRGARWILHDAVSDGKGGADTGPGAMMASRIGRSVGKPSAGISMTHADTRGV